MNKFSYLDYKVLLEDIIKCSPKKGRGEHARLAKHLQVHTTFLTHVLRGKSHFSPEQSIKVADFFNFSPLEKDFFVTLVSFNRAGDEHTRKYFSEKLKKLQNKGFSLKEQLKKSESLSLEEQAVFYSEWTYSAVRLMTALPHGGSVEEIAKHLSLPQKKVRKIVDFLLKSGLCKIENNRLNYGAFSTYVGRDSPFSKKLHDNWRLRSVMMGTGDAEDLNFTSAATLTKKDFLLLREMILELIKKFEKVTDDSNPENLAYLTIDWVMVA